MKTVKLDWETADKITADTVKAHITLVRGSIKRLKAKGNNLSPWQREDLVNDECLLDSLLDVHRYFAGK